MDGAQAVPKGASRPCAGCELVGQPCEAAASGHCWHGTGFCGGSRTWTESWVDSAHCVYPGSEVLRVSSVRAMLLCRRT